MAKIRNLGEKETTDLNEILKRIEAAKARGERSIRVEGVTFNVIGALKDRGFESHRHEEIKAQSPRTYAYFTITWPNVSAAVESASQKIERLSKTERKIAQKYVDDMRANAMKEMNDSIVQGTFDSSTMARVKVAAFIHSTVLANL